ncbi:MAG: GDP-L-fucose synthase [Deltaproteobacteria bacterium]|nr:GDP-L-fucose synthase [Deltaproteobacteria bacterium]
MRYRDAKIYVAGHTGLIGSSILRNLKERGFRNLVTKSHVELDLCNQADVRAFFRQDKPEIVFMCAGRVGGIIENRDHPAEFMAQNLAMAFHTIEASQHYGAKKYFFFGSSCMYPRQCPQPMVEEALLTGKPEATSLSYAVAKLAGVSMCLAFNEQYGDCSFIPVIPNNAYGPRDNFDLTSSHVLAALVRKIHEAKKSKSPKVVLWGTGKPRREFVFVDDIADACLFLLERQLANDILPINIGVGEDLSIAELAAKVAQGVGYSGEIEFDSSKPDGAPRKLLDASRLHRLGWQQKVSLQQGLKITYDWYVNEGEKHSG